MWIKLLRERRRWILLDVLAIIAGVAGGLGAVIFRYAIKFFHSVFFDSILPIFPHSSGYNPFIILVPILGGLIIGPIIFRLAPETKGHAVPETMEAIHLKDGIIRKRAAFMEVLVSSITIGSGGSAGREGPIALIGSSIGSSLGQIFKFKPRDIRLLTVAGLSAGIAGTFNAPLGGALFGMEVISRRFRLLDAVPIILASVVGVAIASTFISFPFEVPKFICRPSELPFSLLLGIVMGLLAFVWVRSFYAIEDVFDSTKIPSWLKPALGGIFVGVAGVFLLRYGIMGVGYEGVNLVLVGGISSLALLVALGIIKILATSFTIGSGGSGGVFAPSLYIGSMFGGVFGLLLAHIGATANPPAYALLGMGALFAGAARAPLTSLVMIPEMYRNYTMLPSFMIACVASYAISRVLLRDSSIYTLKLERRGAHLEVRERPLERVPVRDVMKRNVVTVSPQMKLSELMRLITKCGHMGFPVVEDDEVRGVVTFDDIRKIPVESRSNVKVEDVMTRKIVSVYPEDSVRTALDTLCGHNIGRVIVVDRGNPNKLLGIITKADTMYAYEVESSKSE